MDLKNYIDYGSRMWNAETKYWEVKDTCLGTLITILKKYFGENVTQTLTVDEKKSDNPFREVFSILKKMPNSNIEKIYSALALAIHPDRGGSNDQMKALNMAYEEVKKK